MAICRRLATRQVRFSSAKDQRLTGLVTSEEEEIVTRLLWRFDVAVFVALSPNVGKVTLRKRQRRQFWNFGQIGQLGIYATSP